MLNNYLSTVSTAEINEHLPASEIRFAQTKEEKLESIQITELMVIKGLHFLQGHIKLQYQNAYTSQCKHT